LQTGDYDQAGLLAQECLNHARKAGSVFITALCLNYLGQSAAAKGNEGEAIRYHHQAIQMAWDAEQLPPYWMD